MSECNPGMLLPSVIPSREEQKYSQSLHDTETEISSSLIVHLASAMRLIITYIDNDNDNNSSALINKW